MNQRSMDRWETRRGERGGSRLKFLIVVVVLGLAAYAGYLYLPVQFDAMRFKDLMQHDADVAATQGYPITWITDQLKKSLAEFNIPPDATITPSQQDNRMSVRVQYTRPIEFLGYTYEYEFDHTAKSTAFLTIK
jgi:hypothetical protein